MFCLFLLYSKVNQLCISMYLLFFVFPSHSCLQGALSGVPCAVSRLFTDCSGSEYDLSEFDGDISKWDVSNVTNMSEMFSVTAFNGDISMWDVSKVTDMSGMFFMSQFNGDISKWNVSNVTDMSRMFRDSQFNGDISNWNMSKVTKMSDMFVESKLQESNNIPKWYHE